MLYNLFRHATAMVMKMCVGYAALYIFITYVTRMMDGQYGETGRSMTVPTMGRTWDLTPIFALAVVGFLFTVREWMEEKRDQGHQQ